MEGQQLRGRTGAQGWFPAFHPGKRLQGAGDLPETDELPLLKGCLEMLELPLESALLLTGLNASLAPKLQYTHKSNKDSRNPSRPSSSDPKNHHKGPRGQWLLWAGKSTGRERETA